MSVSPSLPFSHSKPPPPLSLAHTVFPPLSFRFADPTLNWKILVYYFQKGQEIDPSVTSHALLHAESFVFKCALGGCFFLVGCCCWYWKIFKSTFIYWQFNSCFSLFLALFCLALVYRVHRPLITLKDSDWNVIRIEPLTRCWGWRILILEKLTIIKRNLYFSIVLFFSKKGWWGGGWRYFLLFPIHM